MSTEIELGFEGTSHMFSVLQGLWIYVRLLENAEIILIWLLSWIS
jgi:hypothetical protein